MKFLYLFLIQVIFISNLSGQIWAKVHDLGDDEGGYEINALSDGNFLISGKAWNYPVSGSEYLFVKADPDGNVIWDHKYSFGQGGGGYSNIFSFELPQGDGYYIIGNTYELVSTSSYGDIFILHLDAQGDSLWSKTIGTQNIESLSAAFMIENEQQFVFLSSSRNSNTNNTTYSILKVDIEGEIIWNHEFPVSIPAAFLSLSPSPDGNFIASGLRIINNGSTEYDALAMKISEEGDVIWEKTYGGQNWDFFFDQEISKNGNPLFCGTTGSFVPEGFYFVETDWDGNVLDERILPSAIGLVFNLPHPRVEVSRLSNNGYILSTDGSIGNCGYDDSQIYWLDSDRNYFSDEIYGAPENDDRFYSSVQSADGNIIVTGAVYNGDGTDLLLVKYENEYLVDTQSPAFEDLDIKVFPNPFNQEIQIEFPEDITLPVEIELVSLDGKNLLSQTITQRQISLKPGIIHEGIYVLKFKSNNCTQSVKLVKK